MAKNNSGNRVVCLLCKQQLPEGVSFCVACGIQNDSQRTAGRQIGIDNELNRRYEKMSFVQRMFSFLGIGRR